MKISNEVKQRIYHIISITLLATILTSIVNVLYDFRVSGLLLSSIAVVSMTVLYLVHYHRRIFLVLLFSIVVVIGTFLYIKKIPFLLHIQNLWNFVVNYMNGIEELHRNYGIILIILIQVVDCLIATLLCKQNMVKYCSCASTFVAIIVMSLVGFPCTRMLVAYVVLVNLILLVEIGCNQMDATKEKKQVAALHLLPICFTITICIFLLPMREDPIRWTGIRKAISMIKEKGEIVSEQIRLYFAGKDGSYEMSFAGFSDGDSDLGGEIGSDEGIALKLKTSTTEYSGYLIGNVKNIYNGSSWTTKTTKITDESSEYINDLYEFALALSRYQANEIDTKNLIKYENFEIVYEDIHTVTKFYPLKTSRFVESSGNKEKTDHYANLRFKKLKGEGTNYLTYYYMLNMDSEFLKNMLRDSDTFTYEGYASRFDLDELESFGRDFFKQGIKWDTFNLAYIEVLKNRRDRIYKDYISLPEALPDRVGQLAEEITQGLTTNYDKMKAIERYLNSLTYTTKTIEPEQGQDFVDSFLFEQKEGYCTYFASAMAVMGRCLGIPTRYVEGFYVDYKDKKDSYYTVKNADAHAWVEVYFDGIGWIPFEPTPGYVEKFYKEWKPISIEESNSYQSSNPYMGQNQQPPKIPGQEYDKVEVVKTDTRINTDVIFIIAGILGILLLLFFIYFQGISHKMRRLYKDANNATKAVVIYRKIMYHLEKIGLPYTNTETLQVYTTRMDQIISITPHSLKRVNDLYMAIRYGDYTITDEELAIILAYEKEFYEYLKITYGRMKVRRHRWELGITYKKLYNW